MSVTVNGTLLKNQFNDSSATVTEAEYSLVGAINLLNTFGAGLSILTGDAGSKTGSYTSAQAGAILAMAQQIYQKHWKNADGATVQLSSIGVSYSSDSQLLTFAQRLANELKGKAFKRA